MIEKLIKYVKTKHSFINEVSIELTHSCNMSCSFCFNEYSDDFSHEYINYDKLKKILILLKKQGLYKIRITGGEPMLHPDFYRIIILCKKLGFFVKLNTNGILVNNINIKILEKYIDSILFSFHFPREKVKKIDNLKYKAIYLIGRSNIKYKTISIRLNKYVIYNINDICYFFNKFNFSDVLFWFPLKSKNENNFIISKEDYSFLIKKLLILRKIIKIDLVLGFTPAYCFEGKPHLFKKLTNLESYLLGSDKIIVTPNFNTSIIYYYFPDKKIFPYGSFDFDKILNSEFIKKFNSFEWLDKKCNNCDYLIGCFGGNRVNSLMVNGDFFGKDPWMR